MKCRDQNGFTLIEILVAASIFSFAVLGLAAGTVSVIQTNTTSHLQTSAVNLAQGKIEEFRAMSTTALAALSCPAYTSSGCSDAPSASGKAFSRSWQVTANSPVTGVTTLAVKVDWSDYSSRSVTMSASVVQ